MNASMKRKTKITSCISDFCSDVREICALLRYYAAYSGNSAPKCRYRIITVRRAIYLKRTGPTELQFILSRNLQLYRHVTRRLCVLEKGHSYKITHFLPRNQHQYTAARPKGFFLRQTRYNCLNNPKVKFMPISDQI